MAATEQRSIDLADGGRIAYEFRAERDSTLPILALHGVLVGTSNWIHQMLRLPQFRWIVPNIRGHGDSSPSGEHPTIEQAALDMLAVLDAEGVERAVVIGNSLGGTVALALALLRPERVLAMLLAEPSIPQLLFEDGSERLTEGAVEIRQLLGQGHDGLEQALDMMLTPRLGPDWRKKLGRRRLAEWSKNILAVPDWYEAVAEFHPGLGSLAALEVPLLLAYGAQTQPFYRELTEAVADAVPAAQLVEIPDAGHGAPVDNPEAFNALLLDFLAQHGLVSPS
jgi:pimeloyl-ACP methyl ester carboxylesterase